MIYFNLSIHKPSEIDFDVHPPRIHVWYIYLHLKITINHSCRYIYHTWMVWDCEPVFRRDPTYNLSKFKSDKGHWSIRCCSKPRRGRTAAVSTSSLEVSFGADSSGSLRTATASNKFIAPGQDNVHQLPTLCPGR